MAKEKMFSEDELASLAKSYREASGKNRAEAARELAVARPTLIFAEEKPEASLTKLRIRIIEKYSGRKVIGPKYCLRQIP